MIQHLREVVMLDESKIYESDAARAFREELEAKGEARGLAQGRAASLLLVLEQRSVPVPDAVRARVLGCRDLAQLDAWLVRAATATRAQDVFDAD